MTRPTAKPPVPGDEADPGIAAQPPRSSLYDQSTADGLPEKPLPPAARLREDSSRIAVELDTPGGSLGTVMRYQAMLKRDLHRALAQLQRLQAWEEG